MNEGVSRGFEGGGGGREKERKKEGFTLSPLRWTMMILGREAELKESVIDTSCSNSRVSCFPD